MYGPNTWVVRIQNKSTEVVNELAVLVTALDAGGTPVDDACERTDDVNLSDITHNIFSDAVRGSISEIIRQFPAAGLGALGGLQEMMPGMNPRLPNQRQTENAIKTQFGRK